MASQQPQNYHYGEANGFLVRNLRLRVWKDLAVLLNPEAPLGNNWTEVADHFGFSIAEIREMERMGKSGSPTLILFRELAVRRRQLLVVDLLALLKETGRIDCATVLEEAIADYHANQPGPPTAPPPPPYDSIQQAPDMPPDHGDQRGAGLACDHAHLDQQQFDGCPLSFAHNHFQELSPACECTPRNLSTTSGPVDVRTFPSTPAHFDVFLSCAGEDWQFARELREVLGRQGFSVFEYEEDAPAGEDEPELKGNMIFERCRKVILVLSPSYIETEYKMMEASLAKSKSPAAKNSFLIPIMYKECKLPNFLKNVHLLDYYQLQQDPSRLENLFWNKLCRSLHHQR